MKYNHKSNFYTAVACAVVAAIINFTLYGNLLAAVLGAGTLTFLMSLVFNYGADVVQHWWSNRTNKP
jgi:hypothetical protein